MAYLPRGIAPDLLISQVKNTMPYLFEIPERGAGHDRFESFLPASVLRELYSFTLDAAGVTRLNKLSHFEYFRLCVCSHYLTVATPVPTDVDNQIRKKLWPLELDLATAIEMAEFVLKSGAWDFRPVTERWCAGAGGSDAETQVISGHNGEWFTIAAGAYCALGQYRDARAAEKQAELLKAIGAEVNRHSEIFGSLWRAKDGLGCLKSSAVIAHNFGDLDRVMDMWDLSLADPLRIQFYGMTRSAFDSNRDLRFMGRLWVAGELYKSPLCGSAMALENHRHFALRKPRCLRRDPKLMITTGPFLDAWGEGVARILDDTEILEVVEALTYGWSRLPKTLGYGRALLGIGRVRPELRIKVIAGPEAVSDFEAQWARGALELMDEIPGRA